MVRKTRVKVSMEDDETIEGDPRIKRRKTITTTIITTGGTEVRIVTGNDEMIRDRRKGRKETRIHID